MKILFFSDIHGIDTNLNCIKELDKKEKFDKIVVLGDLYYSGPNSENTNSNPMKVKQFLDTFNERLICLKGNCDSDVDIKASDFPICNNLALLYVDGLDIYCSHGNEYSLDKSSKFNRKGILVYGHDHFPSITKKENMIFINVGSISIPRNGINASYCIYEDKRFIIYGISGDIIEQISI